MCAMKNFNESLRKPYIVSIIKPLFVILFFGFFTISCATAPDPSDEIAYATYQETNDPLEPFNRYAFELTRFADFLFLKPISKIYVELIPKYPREMLSNFYSNLREPLYAVNNTLQGNLKGAGASVGRFAINLTLGVAGFFDAAYYMFDISPYPEDFGQTLGVYGVPEGPFLFIPFAGPSSFRGAIGSGLDIFANPLNYNFYISSTGFKTLDDFNDYSQTIIQFGIPIRVLEFSGSSRGFLEQVERESTDFYATIRNIYRQNRRNAILDGELDFDELPEIPDDDFFEE